jgi:CheY-like chemotaxis protein/signal transduction histidine kinase
MFNKLQTNLAFKVALYSVLTAAVLGFLISGHQIWSNLEQREQRNQVFINSLISTTLPSISIATYNFNTQLKQQLINGLAEHPGILNAAIFDTKGGEIGISSIPKPCKPSNINTLLHGANPHFEYPINYRGTYLGKLTLELNHCQQSELFFEDIKRTLVSGLIYSICIALIIYFLFYRLVSLPVSMLASRLQKIDPSAIELSSIQNISSTRKDEIGVLINQFSALLRTTHDHISRLKAAEFTINDYSSNLEALVNKRTEAISGINYELQNVNNELKRTQSNLEQFNQSQTHLLKNLSYELRVPITNTIHTLHFLSDDHSDATHSASLEGAINYNKKVLSLLSELELIAQLKHPQNSNSASPFSIGNLISDITDKITKHNDVSFQIDARYQIDLAKSHIGNRQEIEQLLYNLMANILNNTPEQRINIAISENEQGIIFHFSAPDLRLNDALFEQMITPFSNSYTVNPLTSMGLAYSRDLTEFLDGNMYISINSQNENELSLQLPLLNGVQALEELRKRLPSGGICLNINQNTLLAQLILFLDQWQLPYVLSNSLSKQPILLITDNEALPSHDDIRFIIGIGAKFQNKHKINDVNLLTLKQINEGNLYNLITEASGLIQSEQSPTIMAKVLLVEDNIINRMLSQRFLRNLNVEVDMVEDGKEAVNIANRKQYDMIFMDCQMPIMDGFQATRQIRRSQLNQKTPIVALTGFESEDERLACLQSGMNDFISKPFTQEQLNHALRQWLPK